MMSAPSSMHFLVCLLCGLFCTPRATTGTAQVFPAVFGFGDSIIDTGNNNFLPTIAKSNFPPYGKDFMGHQPTGRYSNGKVPVDFLVSGFRIKESLPAYLDLNLKSEDLLTGVNFASGGSGFDPLTSQLVSVISLDGQLELFKNYKEKLRLVAGDKSAANIINESLYIVVTGNNDVTNYFGSPVRRLQYDFPTYAKFLVRSAATFVKELHNLGARKIAVVGLPPLGCIPSQRTTAGGFQRDCVSSYNQACQKFNHELTMVVQQLSKLLNIKIIYSDIYERLLYLIQHPLDYGFEEVTKGCCGTGLWEASVFCNSLTATTCPDDSKYIFWDGFHPTEKAYAIVMEKIIRLDTPLLF